MKEDFKTAEKIPCNYWITKKAEEELYFMSKQMNCEMNEALDKILKCIGTTGIYEPILKEMGYKFDPNKLP